MLTSRHRRAQRKAAERGEPFDRTRVNPRRSGQRTRERQVIATVACPVCDAPLGAICRPLSDGDRAITETGRVWVHGDRRRAWQGVRAGDIT